MKKTILSLVTIFTVLATPLIYAQENNTITLMPKPSFFPKEPEKISQVSISKIIMNEKDLEKQGVTKKEVETFVEYYAVKSKEFFKEKYIRGYITAHVEVSSKKEEQSKELCEEKPTMCSLTKILFDFSDNIEQAEREEFHKFIMENTIKDGIEIFVKNHDYKGKSNFIFNIYLDEESKKKNSTNEYPDVKTQSKKVIPPNKNNFI